LGKFLSGKTRNSETETENEGQGKIYPGRKEVKPGNFPLKKRNFFEKEVFNPFLLPPEIVEN
jgi:hypothetical protein